MREIKVNTPVGMGETVARLAISCGANSTNIYPVRSVQLDGEIQAQDCVIVLSSNPVAKQFLETLMEQPYFSTEEYALALKRPAVLLNEKSAAELTCPWVMPTPEVSQELWEFSHVTAGMILRFFFGGLLLAYGMVQDRLLLMLAGLLFLPFNPLILAMSIGSLTRQWPLARQGLKALFTAIAVLLLAGVTVGMATAAPMYWHDRTTLLSGVIMSTLIGSAAGLAAVDDAGRRELIGLAAASQLALIPVWLGVSLMFGFTAADEPGLRLTAFVCNLAALTLASVLTFWSVHMRSAPERELRRTAEPRLSPA